MNRKLVLALALTIGWALPGFAVDPTIQMWQVQPGNDGLAVAAARQAIAAGKFADAEKYLTTCVGTGGQHRLAKAELGWLRYLQGKPTDAVVLLKESEQPPDDPLGESRLAWVYAELGRRPEAIKAALAARKSKDVQPLALQTLGVLADDGTPAQQYLTEAVAASTSPWPAYYLGKRSEGDVALRAYGEAFKRSLASQEPYEVAAKGKALTAIVDLLDSTSGLRQQWSDQLDALVTLYPQDLALSDMLVEAYMRSGKQEFAIAELRRRLGFATNKAVILRQIGRMYVDLAQDELALETYERASKIMGIDQRSPLANEIRCDRIVLLLGAKRESEANVELDRILKETPDNRRAKLLKGLALSLQQDWPKAAEMIAGIEPMTPEERLLVNEIRYRQGQPVRWAQIFGGTF